MASGIEFSDLDWLAIILAIVANMVIGFVWYAQWAPTGKVWMKAMNIPAGAKPEPKQMMVSLFLMVVGAFLLMFVLQHVYLAFRDAYQLDGARLAGITYGDGASGAFYTWIGFFVPVYLGTVAWEGKPWKLFLVNVGYWLVTLQIAGAIFAWRL